mgnify:CR=1 FL=1
MEERITRGKAIRLKCLDCCCGNSAEVRRCPVTKCPLWRYRMGNENKAKNVQQNGDFQKSDLGV